jgi:hypothetical protein
MHDPGQDLAQLLGYRGPLSPSASPGPDAGGAVAPGLRGLVVWALDLEGSQFSYPGLPECGNLKGLECQVQCSPHHHRAPVPSQVGHPVGP